MTRILRPADKVIAYTPRLRIDVMFARPGDEWTEAASADGKEKP